MRNLLPQMTHQLPQQVESQGVYYWKYTDIHRMHCVHCSTSLQLFPQELVHQNFDHHRLYKWNNQNECREKSLLNTIGVIFNECVSFLELCYYCISVHTSDISAPIGTRNFTALTNNPLL